MAWERAAIRESMLLYAVTDRAWLRGRTLTDCVRQAIEGGATFVQLREKSAPQSEAIELGKELAALCHAAGVPFVVDDDVEVARAAGADGVHVGQEDMACAQARAALGPDAIVGVSAQTVEQALQAQADGADYLGVGGPIPTPTKPDAAGEMARARVEPVDGNASFRTYLIDALYDINGEASEAMARVQEL